MEGPRRRVVGLVRGVHGLRGAVRVEVLTDAPERRFATGASLYAEGSAEPLTVESSEPVPDGPGWRLRFHQLPSRTDAEQLRGVYLEADVDEPIPADRADSGGPRVFWDEVIGVAVRSPTGEELGTVRDVYRAGEAEVYVVEGGDRGSFDLPVVRDFVLEFAPREGRLVVDPAALELPEPGRRRRPRGRRTVRAARAAEGGAD
ncbi:MAG TPA: ribosome maturation factor RimM [Candidatus Limnocylindrales bacterium]|nr:ribosome maturation factor RimM [Candidatus Limnocylindrales bacterium]